MTCEPYWVTPSLAIVPRPRGKDWLYDEMRAMRQAGIDVLVSMLEPAEAKELGLDEEEIAARRAGMRFISFPIPDRAIPSDIDQFDRLVSLLDRLVKEGKRIGVHCRACIGRSTVVLASVLVGSGMTDDEAWKLIRAARGVPVPDTSEQREFVAGRARPQKPWHLL